VFTSLNFDINHTPFINCNNLQTVRIINKEAQKLVTKVKNVDIEQCWLRQEAQRGTITVKWQPTTEMKADGFTKVLPRQRHEVFVRQLNLVDIRERIEAGRQPNVD